MNTNKLTMHNILVMNILLSNYEIYKKAIKKLGVGQKQQFKSSPIRISFKVNTRLRPFVQKHHSYQKNKNN